MLGIVPIYLRWDHDCDFGLISNVFGCPNDSQINRPMGCIIRESIDIGTILVIVYLVVLERAFGSVV